MFEARLVLEDSKLLEMRIGEHSSYRLRFGLPGDWRVAYEDGVRRIGARASAYEFRSVEQLRYDFERDVEDARDPDR